MAIDIASSLASLDIGSGDRNNTSLKSNLKDSRSQKNSRIYFTYRKDALEMSSLVSQHFEAAREAYRRKDYRSAKQYSTMAKEEIHVVRELNSKAATDILKIQNCQNNLWRIDLHGLHKNEAIQALRVHLNKIESQPFLTNNSEQKEFHLQKRLKTLQVITGVGKHSQGKPVLPNSIKNFLNENHYHFEEIRPGALKVWPKKLGMSHLENRLTIQV